MAESAFIVRVPEAESSVGALRNRCDPSAAVGVPAHITVLFPFMSPDRIKPRILSEAEKAVRVVPAFSFTLGQVRRWPETTYLAPEPVAPFEQLTNALIGAFPEFPPYGGKHREVVPHLTVADRSAVFADEAEAALRVILSERGPIVSTCRSVEILENSSGIWRLMHVIALKASDG